MNVLIVNLADSQQRLKFQKNQFERLGMSFQRVNAVSVHDIDESQYLELGFGWQRPLRKVELACFLSHQKAWEAVLNSQQPALILEDDAVLANHLPELLDEVEASDFHGIDLINFEVRSRKKIISKQAYAKIKSANTVLFRLYQDRTGAAGYLLYPSGAEKLLNKLSNSSPAIADGFIFSCYALNALQAEPAAIIQEDQLNVYGVMDGEKFDSIIGRSEHYQPVYKSKAEKYKFKKARLEGQWAMACRYLSVMFIAQKRFIRLDSENFK